MMEWGHCMQSWGEGSDKEAREPCKISLTAIKGHGEGMERGRDRDSIVKDGRCQKIRALVPLADSL